MNQQTNMINMLVSEEEQQMILKLREKKQNKNTEKTIKYYLNIIRKHNEENTDKVVGYSKVKKEVLINIVEGLERGEIIEFEKVKPKKSQVVQENTTKYYLNIIREHNKNNPQDKIVKYCKLKKQELKNMVDERVKNKVIEEVEEITDVFPEEVEQVKPKKTKKLIKTKDKIRKELLKLTHPTPEEERKNIVYEEEQIEIEEVEEMEQIDIDEMINEIVEEVEEEDNIEKMEQIDIDQMLEEITSYGPRVEKTIEPERKEIEEPRNEIIEKYYENKEKINKLLDGESKRDYTKVGKEYEDIGIMRKNFDLITTKKETVEIIIKEIKKEMVNSDVYKILEPTSGLNNIIDEITKIKTDTKIEIEGIEVVKNIYDKQEKSLTEEVKKELLKNNIKVNITNDNFLKIESIDKETDTIIINPPFSCPSYKIMKTGKTETYKKKKDYWKDFLYQSVRLLGDTKVNSGILKTIYCIVPHSGDDYDLLYLDDNEIREIAYTIYGKTYTDKEYKNVVNGDVECDIYDEIKSTVQDGHIQINKIGDAKFNGCKVSARVYQIYI